MRRKKSILSIMLTFTLLLTLFSSTASAAANQNANVQKDNQNGKNIQSYVSAMQPGWNLGNSFDATGATKPLGATR